MSDIDKQKPPSPIRRVLSAIAGVACLITGAQSIEDQLFEHPQIDYFGAVAGLLFVLAGLVAIMDAIRPRWWGRSKVEPTDDPALSRSQERSAPRTGARKPVPNMVLKALVYVEVAAVALVLLAVIALVVIVSNFRPGSPYISYAIEALKGSATLAAVGSVILVIGVRLYGGASVKRTQDDPD